MVMPGVTPRMRRVSRNLGFDDLNAAVGVTPRMRRVSRNKKAKEKERQKAGHASHEACE